MKHSFTRTLTQNIIAAVSSLILAMTAVCGAAYAESSTPGLKGLQEAGGEGYGEPFTDSAADDTGRITGIEGLEPFTAYELDEIAPSTSDKVAECIIDGDYGSDTVNRSCTIKSLDHDLVIGSSDEDIVILLDDLTLDNTITVRKTTKRVIFFIKGTFTCGGNSRGILYDNMGGGSIVRYNDTFPVRFYSEKEANMAINGNCTFCGYFRAPELTMECGSEGAFEVEYISEMCEGFDSMIKCRPMIIGGAIVGKIEYAEENEAFILSARSTIFDEYIPPVRYGDANCDRVLDLADAIFIMQAMANPDRYTLTSDGRTNADTNGDGVTVNDALAIQQHLLGLDKK
jgi:hypothetical protein